MSSEATNLSSVEGRLRGERVEKVLVLLAVGELQRVVAHFRLHALDLVANAFEMPLLLLAGATLRLVSINKRSNTHTKRWVMQEL